MKFEKLRVTGFKSFVDPIEFRIDPGLTGVVGPNGCGKSNLVEALCWVMGENSYKNMRASAMDDVIFSGNSDRPARNAADVTLVLDNQARTAPVGFNSDDRLEISRRIVREGGSVYRINGKECRARDVQLLFADASTGAHSPAMVRQGQVSEIISAKPTQRRNLLEEAAGITGLHSRRHEAELRLKGAEQNLLRLEDVIRTMEGQLDSLKKQARQASRFRNLSSEIRKANAALHYVRLVEAADSLHDAEEHLGGINVGLADTARAQGEAAREQAIAAHEITGLRDKEVAAGAALQTLVVARDQLDAEEQRAQDRLRELQTRVAQFADDLAREQRQIKDAGDHLARLQSEERDLNDRQANSVESLADAQARLSASSERLGSLEQDLTGLTWENADLTAERRVIRKAIENERADLTRVVRKLDDVAQDLARIEVELQSIDGGAELGGQLTDLEGTLLDAEDRQASAETAVETARAAEVAARGPLLVAERDLHAIDTEIRTLERLSRASTGSFDESAVVDSLTVPAGLERALGAVLGDELEAPWSETAPVRWTGAERRSTDPMLPDGARSLADLVEHPGVLDRRLTQTGLVEEAEGPGLQPQLAPGQRLVSSAGTVWRWDGLVREADAPSAAVERLATRNRLKELTDQRPLAEETVTERRRNLDQAQATIEACRTAHADARKAVRALQDEIAGLRARISETEKARARLVTRKSGVEDYLKALTGNRQRGEARLAQAEQRLLTLPAHDQLGERIAKLQVDVADLRHEVIKARGAVDAINRDRDADKRRLSALVDEAARVRRRSEGAERQFETLEERRAATVLELEDLQNQPDAHAARRRGILARIDTAEADRATAADRRAAGEARLARADREARAANEALTVAREGQIRAEERLASARQRLAEVQQRIQDDLECAPFEAARIAELHLEAELPSIDGIERRLERLKAERERLGGVNLRADEEYQAVEAQRTEVVAERDDLVAAIAKLRQAVGSLNREARQRLLVAFDKVQEHFRDLFTLLFDGGNAELKLIDSDDPLEAGLEIFARPPGKRPQTMTLLSGGEQSLTIIALIFAVFLTNPAPICVLDEVDAPLDDANVERFCDLLESMSERSVTRFLAITHNPITMARMNRLFGVTMVERGVSQLVSVDLDTAERMLEAV